jgi:hypothetical protein
MTLKIDFFADTFREIILDVPNIFKPQTLESFIYIQEKIAQILETNGIKPQKTGFRFLDKDLKHWKIFEDKGSFNNLHGLYFRKRFRYERGFIYIITAKILKTN